MAERSSSGTGSSGSAAPRDPPSRRHSETRLLQSLVAVLNQTDVIRLIQTRTTESSARRESGATRGLTLLTSPVALTHAQHRELQRSRERAATLQL